ncbi:hypothetical protein JTE90_006252 [Oedothorax gibbosus]|uniref:BolA-like protein 2 n=1 Tax=Oedothorax gibbosus TaxID=931172 RepID=A0AAV6U9D0_9ARAC|nr:hypothetical protein JTE90_006252 [Oedothorax gibbosus]
MPQYNQDYIQKKLQEELETTHLDVQDLSDGCGAKFHALIVTPKFEGVALLQRHRMVNEILKTELESIHAFNYKTLTPEQWEKQNASSASKKDMKCEGLCKTNSS